jgi:hypothetical protein
MEVEIVTPAGRKRYLELLYNNLKLQKSDFDQWTIWLNTTHQSDIEYCYQLEKENSWIKILNCPIDPNGSWSVHSFYKHACDPNKVYIKMDDDIVWLEFGFIKKLTDFRKAHPEYFLVYGNTINNSIIDHIHQRQGATDIEELIGYDSFDHNGWKSPEIAFKKHKNLLNSILNNTLEKFKFKPVKLFYFERVSINCVSWLGSEFLKFDGIVGIDDEQWLSSDFPKSIKKPNVIYGDTLCSHFAFHTQRNYLDTTNILDKYQAILSLKDAFNIS